MTGADILEVGNGVWAILAAWLTIFMAFHVLIIRMQRKIKWSMLLFNFRLPLSVQMALGTLAVAFGVFLTRFVLWLIRFESHGEVYIGTPHSFVYGLGVAIGVVGFLCMLRTVSQPTFGYWPWIGALTSAGIYILWWAVRLI